MLYSPRSIHKNVLSICKQIQPSEKPIFVDVVPEPSAFLDECFFNVQEKIKKDGGSILHGWCLWERPGIFIEAEFHAIWVSSKNDLIDVTPKKDRESKILFLPDPKEVFDENSFTRRNNIRLAIRDHPDVHAFIQSAVDLYKYEVSCTDPDNPSQFKVNDQIYREYAAKQNYFAERLMALSPSRNDPCSCGSGVKFKKCCGKQI